MTLLNISIGSLSSSDIITIRGINKIEYIWKNLEYIMCLLPSFVFYLMIV